MGADVAERLRTAREARGLSAAEVAAQLKVPVAYIEALDGGNADALPEATFVRGYARAYARLVGIDAAEVSALLAPVEVKAPRPLVGISDIPAKSAKRAGGRAPARLPRPRRHHFMAAGVLLLVAGGWVTWAGREPSPEAAAPAVPAMAVAPTPALDGGVSLEVPLPGVTSPTLPGTTPVPGAATAGAAIPLPLPAAAGSAALPATPATGPATAATATPAVPAAATTPAAPAVPREGLLVRFSGACWIEVRDGDNKVIHRSSETAGKDLRIQGKEPLTVTLGAAEHAALWWNGDQVELDRFSRAGVARVNVGRIAR